jgi:hypothetical protein
MLSALNGAMPELLRGETIECKVTRDKGEIELQVPVILVYGKTMENLAKMMRGQDHKAANGSP